MPRKVIIDCDPGIDDALALTLALFDPRLEVVAITAVAGNVTADRATMNVQAIVERLDPPRYPRLGMATANDDAPFIDGPRLHGPEGLGSVELPVSKLARQHPAEKIISDEVRSSPGDITLICLGPLTNIARALAREPELAENISRVIIRGGSARCVGDVTPSAEFNMYADPAGARAVFRSVVTKTVIPLDVTDQVVWSLDLLENLPSELSRAGKLLRPSLSYYFRSCRQHLGMESVRLPDAMAIAALVHPELFKLEDLAGDVETSGDLTTGVTVFDRRPHAAHGANSEVALQVDAAAVADYVVRGLTEAGRQTGG